MYYPLYGFLYLLSLLPLRLLYFFSDIAFLLLHDVFGYRKDIVRDNLLQAFPEKTEAERKKIARQFYRNFTDNFFEILKLLSASQAFLRRHFVIDNQDVFEKYYREGRKCQLLLGHTFNWEMANLVVPLYSQYTFLTAYMPLESKLFDRLQKNLRSRTGAIMLPATSLTRSILPFRHRPYLLALVADQSPGNPQKAYWLNFFGRPTPMIPGPEKGARAGNIPVVFGEIHKSKRGYYRATLELGAENPAELAEGELTRRYVAFLESAIRKNPSMWLWSHRRWKHDWKGSYQAQWIGIDGLLLK